MDNFDQHNGCFEEAVGETQTPPPEETFVNPPAVKTIKVVD